MNDNIVFISPDFDSVNFEKIAEMLRTQQIQTTNDINLATIIIKPHNQPKNLIVAMICNVVNKDLTIAKLVEQQVEKTQQELAQLIEQSMTFKIPEVLDFPDIQLLNPKTKKKHKVRKFVSQRNLKQYNQTKQTYKQILFNRTRCK